MICFGGDSDLGLSRRFNVQTFIGDPVWVELSTGGLQVPYVSGHAGIYDPIRYRLITIGGKSSTLQGGAWALDLNTRLWSSLTPSGGGPGPVYGHTAVYDPVGDRIIVFGGRNETEVLGETWVLSLSGSPAWQQMNIAGPGPRFDHTAVYDSSGERMIVYGGNDGSNGGMSDVWALNLIGTPAWSRIVPGGVEPPSRWDHAALYDPGTGRMLVLGGWGYGQGVSNDLWALTLDENPTWSLIVPFSYAGPRWISHTAILDTNRNRMVIFGGRQQNGFLLNESWEIPLDDPATRTEIRRASPPNDGHAAVYDPVGDRMIVFGGEAGGQKRNDVWSAIFAESNLISAVWEIHENLPGAPSPRTGASGQYDPQHRRMIVFGGDDGTFRNDTWSLDLDSLQWSEITPGGELPPPREGQEAAYVPGYRSLYVFGGYNGTFPADLWRLDLSGDPAWEEVLTLATPSGRVGHSLVYDSIRNRLLLFGGYGGGGYRNDVWSLTLTGTPRWRSVTAAGTAPSPRAWHMAMYDPIRDRMIIQGGTDGEHLYDGWELSLSGTPTWDTMCGDVAIWRREDHTAVYDLSRDRMLVYGAQSGNCLGVIWGMVGGVETVDETSVGGFRILPPHPNPARAGVNISFETSVEDQVAAAIVDSQGQLVRTLFEKRTLSQGVHSVTWDGRDEQGRATPRGVYFCRFLCSSGVYAEKTVRLH